MPNPELFKSIYQFKTKPPSTSMAPKQTQEKKKSMLKKSAKKKKTQLKHKLLIAKANAPPRNRGPRE